MTVPIDVAPPQVLPPLHAIIDNVPKPEEVPWHHSPDVWVAVGTLLLTAITGVLAYYTWRLFKGAQEAHTDATNALTIGFKASYKRFGSNDS